MAKKNLEALVQGFGQKVIEKQRSERIPETKEESKKRITNNFLTALKINDKDNYNKEYYQEKKKL